MQKTYCSVCRKEIKHKGDAFVGVNGKIGFNVLAEIREGEDKDLCLGCTITAINKEAYKILKRPYTKPIKPAKVVDQSKEV